MNTPRVQEIANGVVVRVAVDNTGWIDLGDGMAIVDTLEQPELEGEIFSQLEEHFPNKPVRYVINTHTHYDHVALNDAFTSRWQATLLNQKTTPLQSGGSLIGGPARSIALDLLPGCHTQDDWLIWLPSDRILFVGDLFGWGVLPWPGNLKQEKWELIVQAYKRFIELNPTWVVPGHGPLCSAKEMQRCLDYFIDLVNTIAQRCATEENDESIIASLLPPDDMADWWRFTLWKHEDNVKKVLKAVRRGFLHV